MNKKSSARKKAPGRRKSIHSLDGSARRPSALVPQPEFYQTVTDILRTARSNAYRAINFAMVEAYWNVGRAIVEEEQRGDTRS